jgi:hypothetical protein
MVAHPLLQRAPLLLVVALARPRAAQAVGHEPGDQHRSDPAGGDPGKQKTQRPGHARHPFWARGRASRPAVAGTAGLCREAAARHGTSIRPPRACLARFAAGRIHLHQRSPASGSGPAPASSDQSAPRPVLSREAARRHPRRGRDAHHGPGYRGPIARSRGLGVDPGGRGFPGFGRGAPPAHGHPRAPRKSGESWQNGRAYLRRPLPVHAIGHLLGRSGRSVRTAVASSQSTNRINGLAFEQALID